MTKTKQKNQKTAKVTKGSDASEEKRAFRGTKGFEEIPIKDYTQEEKLCKIYEVKTNAMMQSDIREATHYRNLNEKFDRIFYQKTFAFVW